MIDLVRECATQWPEFLKACARDAEGGTIWEGDGVGAAWVNTPFPICNGTYLTGPVADATDLERRISMAVEFASGADLPWLFYVCQDWVPASLHTQFESIFARFHLSLAVRMTGMVATEILPPRRPMPDIRIERIKSNEQRAAAADLQAFAYSFPVDLCRMPVDTGALWGKTAQFGYIAYAGDLPVSTATALVLDGRLYVALVATHPDHQRKGYAEAVMRHSLDESARVTGLTRTVLHASQAGYPIYAAMGYQPTSTVVAFGPQH